MILTVKRMKNNFCQGYALNTPCASADLIEYVYKFLDFSIQCIILAISWSRTHIYTDIKVKTQKGTAVIWKKTKKIIHACIHTYI